MLSYLLQPSIALQLVAKFWEQIKNDKNFQWWQSSMQPYVHVFQNEQHTLSCIVFCISLSKYAPLQIWSRHMHKEATIFPTFSSTKSLASQASRKIKQSGKIS